MPFFVPLGATRLLSRTLRLLGRCGRFGDAPSKETVQTTSEGGGLPISFIIYVYINMQYLHTVYEILYILFTSQMTSNCDLLRLGKCVWIAANSYSA